MAWAALCHLCAALEFLAYVDHLLPVDLLQHGDQFLLGYIVNLDHAVPVIGVLWRADTAAGIDAPAILGDGTDQPGELALWFGMRTVARTPGVRPPSKSVS